MSKAIVAAETPRTVKTMAGVYAVLKGVSVKTFISMRGTKMLKAWEVM